MVCLLLLKMGTGASLVSLRVTQSSSPAIMAMFCQDIEATHVCPVDTGQGMRLLVYVSIILTA